MPKGFTATTLAIIVTIVLTSSLIGWVLYSNATAPMVSGVSTTGVSIEPGFSVDVISNSGTWDVYVFLCEKKDACLSSLNSGVRWITRGGGVTADSEVFVETADSWKKYDYVKVFAKAGWGSPDRKFTVAQERVPVDVSINEVEGVNVVLLPTEDLHTDFYKVARFSDLIL